MLLLPTVYNLVHCRKERPRLLLSHVIFLIQGMLGIKPGLHEPQLQVEWSVTFAYSLVVEQRC